MAIIGIHRRYFNIHSEFTLPSLPSSIGPTLTMSGSTTMINPQHHHSQNRGIVHHLHHLHMHFNKQDPAVREELIREMTAALGTLFSGENLEFDCPIFAVDLRGLKFFPLRI